MHLSALRLAASRSDGMFPAFCLRADVAQLVEQRFRKP
jgi:hypothetical protein